MALDNVRLLWLDLEMTGLDPKIDHILEIAALITNAQLQIESEPYHAVVYQPEPILALMDDVVKKMHTISGLIDHVRESTFSIDNVCDELIKFITEHVGEQKLVLAGNTIWQDRTFIRAYMPTLEKYLHYRMLDVSSIKLLINNWYPKDPNAKFKKKKAHRAVDDIYESIAELSHYRRNFFKQ